MWVWLSVGLESGRQLDNPEGSPFHVELIFTNRNMLYMRHLDESKDGFYSEFESSAGAKDASEGIRRRPLLLVAPPVSPVCVSWFQAP